MARRTKLVTVTADGRDKGKMFLITEMPASQAERWATRALMSIAGTFDIPENVQQAGMAGIATLGLKALAAMPYHEADPLLSEMFACIECVPNPAHTEVHRALIEDDIEEVATRMMLRGEVLDVHVGFSVIGYLREQREELAKNITNSSDTSTSPIPSELSSRVNSHPSPN